MLRLGTNRREFLQVGTAGIGGLTLLDLLAADSAGATMAKSRKDRAVVVLNLQGGPTQYEMFDPKMTAPREIRSITGEVKTSLPGVTFGGTLPLIAQHAHRMAVIRSYRHGISSHGPAAKHVMAGGNPTKAMMGALFARMVGLTDPNSGMPQNALVTPSSISKKNKALYHNRDRVSQTGSLPSSYKPFDPGAGGQLIQNMKLKLSEGDFNNRRALLKKLDLLRRSVDRNPSINTAGRLQQTAFDVLAKGISSSFDISKEDPRLVARYDTSAFVPTEGAKKRNQYAKMFSPVALGKQMLLARRLCEAGCGFVTVTQGGWDMHGGGKEFTMKDGLASLTPAVDKAVSAFIEDVHQRGLDKKILLVITGEFGRTPRINKNGGRDHWGNLCTLAFVGGGLKMGQVVGRSDRIGGAPASKPITSAQVLSTVMHSLFDFGELRLVPGLDSDVQNLIVGGSPIREVI